MRNRKVIHLCVVLFVLLLITITSLSVFAADREKAAKGISIVNYRGWADSYLLSNGTVEAAVVPAVGRVMQFHFVGKGDVFWENDALKGKSADASGKEWSNFGGD